MPTPPQPRDIAKAQAYAAEHPELIAEFLAHCLLDVDMSTLMMKRANTILNRRKRYLDRKANSE